MKPPLLRPDAGAYTDPGESAETVGFVGEGTVGGGEFARVRWPEKWTTRRLRAPTPGTSERPTAVSRTSGATGSRRWDNQG